MRELTAKQKAAFAEFRKARDRILKGASGAMSWLLNFHQTRLDDLSEGDFRNLSIELYVFSNGLWKRTKPEAQVQHIGKPGLALDHCPDTNEVKKLQSIIRARLDEILSDGGTDFWFGKFGLSVRLNEPGTGRGIFPVLGTQRDGFTYYLSHVLGEYAHRMGQCPECARLYIAIRLHQRFCSPRCRSRSGTREYRKAHSKAPRPTRME